MHDRSDAGLDDGKAHDPTPLRALLRQAKTRPEAVAVIAETQAWTYRRLAADSERLAKGLRAAGLKPGDRVALHLRNRIELVLAYYACFRLGAIAAPLNVRLTAAELEDLLRRLDATLFLSEEGLRATFEPIADDVLPLAARFVVGLRGDRPREKPFEPLLSSRDDRTIPEPATTSPAIIVPTSGTTDKPKFAVWTPQSLASGIAKMSNIHLEAGVTALIATPMVHGAALTFLLAGVLFGGTAVLLEQFDADEALRLIEDHEIGWLFGLPTMIASLIECQKATPHRTESLKVGLVAGDVSPPELHEAFAAVFGMPLRSVLASTEIGWPFQPGGTSVAIGRIPPGLDYGIVDLNGRDVPAGEGGELRLRQHDCLSIGYWQGPDRLDDPARGGWFATGDLVRLDAAGDLWFVGRAKDVIVRGGSNVSPAEVEAVLMAHPAIAEAAVVGLPDAKVGQRVAAAVVIGDGREPPTPDEIIAFARSRLATYKLPERVEIVPSLPRSTIGKLDRRALARTLGEGDSVTRP